MFFVDNSGHIFEITDYTKKPIGYEFDETPYVFWLSDNNENSRLSINNYYAKAINLLFPIENVSNFNNQSISDILNINVTIDSKIFSLIPSNKFQESLREAKSILDYISSFDDYDVCKEYLDSLNKDQIIEFGNNYNIKSNNALDEDTIKENILSKLIFAKQELTSDNDDDLLAIKVIENNKNFILLPLYIIGNASEEGTWSSNILVHISYKYTDKNIWCPFSVGGTFADSYESLIIHGANMGVNLPKDIIKAINGTSFYNDEFNHEIFNKKLKEYMLNYMSIHGECGNYNSALTALKWFGYKDKVTLYKLIETSNEFKHQYIRDYFDIHNNLLMFFKEFIHTQYVSVLLKLNTETGKLDKQYPSNDSIRWGEGLPLLKDLINETEFVNTKEYFLSQEYTYIDKYFKYSLNELLLKLSCLAFYYSKYFLPLYLKLNNVSAQYKVYANDVKLYSYSNNGFIEKIINVCDWNDNVTFDKFNVRYLTHQYHYVDENFNEFYLNGLGDNGNYEDDINEWYIINDSCISVPIHFKYYENDPSKNYYECMLFLKDNESNITIFNSTFNFLQTQDYKYNAFIIYPKLIEKKLKVKQSYINKSFTLYIYANGTYYEYSFTIKAPEFNINIGKLEYKYWGNDINYLNEKYHEFDVTENGNVINNSNFFITLNDYEDNEDENQPIDITEYIKNYDFFDDPTQYMSPFSQIDYINDNEVKFNTFMHNPDFVDINDLNLGLDLCGDKTMNNLIDNYKQKVNIGNSYKYLNNVHLYELYKISEEKTEIDVLKFYKNITCCVGDVIIHKNHNRNGTVSFSIIGNTSSTINTIDDIDHYPKLLNNETPELIENKAWYYILKRDENYNITGDSVDSLYSVYENNPNNIGYIIFDNVEDAKNNSNPLYVNIKGDYNNVKVINNKYVYDKKNLYYKNSFVKYEKGEYINYNPTAYDFHYNYQNIFIKLELYYYDEVKILNLFGYYNSNSLSNIKCSNYNSILKTCTVTIYDPVDYNKESTPIKVIHNVKLHESKYYQYTDISKNTNGLVIYNQNPSAVWVTLDEDNNIVYNDSINEINIELYNGDNVPNLYDEENLPKYINYLVCNLTGLSGKYRLECETDAENKNNIKVKVAITTKDGLIYYIENDNDFSLQGNEKSAIVYFEVSANSGDFEFIPHIYKYDIIEYPVEYIYNDYEAELSLYKKLFYKKYTLSCTDNNGVSKHIKDIWESKIQYNNMYDTYLMHGYTDKGVLKLPESQRKTYPQSWYFVFISKDTCDKFENTSMLNKYKEKIEFEINNDKYILRHIDSKKLFLINRMKFISNKGINHFKKDDLIVCSLENNSKLPTNFELHAKWNIRPLTFGIDPNIKIIGNGNKSILSIPKNDNVYNYGYYEIEIIYSINRSFINNQVIKQKILIEK